MRGSLLCAGLPTPHKTTDRRSPNRSTRCGRHPTPDLRATKGLSLFEIPRTLAIRNRPDTDDPNCALRAVCKTWPTNRKTPFSQGLQLVGQQAQVGQPGQPIKQTATTFIRHPNPSANTRQVRGRAFQFHNWPQQCPQSQNQPQCQYCNWNARPQFQHIPNQTASARNTSSTPISVNHFQFPHPADAGCLLTSGCARQCDFCCSMDRDQAPAGPRTVATGEAKRNPWGMWSQTGSAPEGQRNFLCDRTSSPSSFTAKS